MLDIYVRPKRIKYYRHNFDFGRFHPVDESFCFWEREREPGEGPIIIKNGNIKHYSFEEMIPVYE